MKLIYLLAFVISTSLLQTTILADTWVEPMEKDYFSDNNMFAAHITPSQKQVKAKNSEHQSQNCIQIRKQQLKFTTSTSP